MTPDVIETVQDEYLLEESLLLGLNAYLHIKWSAASPTQDSDLKNTPDAYIGVCTDNNADAPTSYTAYAWYQYKGIKGDTGAGLEFIWNGTQLGVRQEGDTVYTYVDLKGATGDTGATGRGITEIERTAGTGVAGATDTYTITYSDNTTSTFNVVNGADSYLYIRWAAAQPTQDSDMSTTPNDWIGICASNSTSAPAHYGSYVWKYVKGPQGATGPQGAMGATGAGLEFNWNSTQLGVRQAGGSIYNYVDLKGATGATGNGISSVTLKSGNHAAGTTDTYTIAMTSGATVDFSVYNGADGEGAGDMLAAVFVNAGGTGKVLAAADSDKLGGVAASGYAKEINGQAAFTDIADTDYLPMFDTSAASQMKSLWSNIKSVLKTYFDTIYQAVITGGASTITSSNLTASRALASNSSGKVAVSTVTATELGYVSGVTSAIQTQLGGKQATITGGATTIASSNLTASRALSSDSNGKVASSTVTATELGYVSGVTGAIQTQLNAKMPENGSQTAFTDIDDADYVPMYDTSATAQKKSLWSTVKSVLKTYFDTLYAPKSASGANTTNSTTGRSITHSFGSIAATAYRVIIIPTLTAAPTTSTAGSLGEVYVVKAADGTFTVYNTGVTGVAFDWLAMKA